MRPGRFDRHVSVDLPTLQERVELFELYMRRVKLENTVMRYAKRLAHMTPGFSGNCLKNILV